MKMSTAGLDLIRKFEGFVSKPYRCPAGVPTIGYGSTLYPDGRAVKLTDPAISKAQAEVMMQATLIKYEQAVERYAQVPLTQGQFDALTDFAYNCGIGNLQKSTLLSKVNRSDFKGAAAEFGKWVFGGGKKLNGLVARRAAEVALFLS
jgi:lysozyme